MVAVTTSARASVEISAAPTMNMACSAGVCAPTKRNAVLNADDLAGMLAASDVKIVTRRGALSITVASSFSWASSHRLTLAADFNVSFKAPVAVAGPGGVTITVGGGDLLFLAGGKIDFWEPTSSLIVGHHAYTLVNSIEELAEAIAADRFGFYAFAKDYDASPDGTYLTAPIPTKLQGIFEGLGHTISNFAVNDRQAKCVGFFDYIAPKGTVRDIRLTSATISPNLVRYAREGILAGCNEGVIANSFTDGTVKGWWVGGLVGYDEGLVTASSSNAVVEGKFAGGLVGVSESDGVIQRSHAGGAVTGDFSEKRSGIVIYAGGLAGVASNVLQSYATGPVSVRGKYYLLDRHSGGGGLVGHLLQGTVADSYATGTVSGDRASVIGGLIGLSERDGVRNSYATGAITGAAVEGAAQGGAIGLVFSKTDAADAYWDIDTSEQAQGCGAGDCSGVAGLTDAQLKSDLPAGFDPAVWGLGPSVNNGYPYLLANPPD